jgi:hypothetical protein
MKTRQLALALVAALAFATTATADKDDRKDRAGSLSKQWVKDLAEGKAKLEGDHAAVHELILRRNIPITYEYVASLMRAPNAFGSGPACIVCHAAADPKTSYRGLDLSSCEGIRRGSTESPARRLFEPGQAVNKTVLGRRLRNNRMPLGVNFHVTPDSPPYRAVRAWIAGGALDDDTFRKDVLPLFAKANAFAPNTPACTVCHMSNQEPPSFHELDLGSHAGIMLGADSVAKGVDRATKVVIPGKPDESGLFQHLVEDRMPPGISPTEERDHPNTRILLRWIEQGAPCK